MSKKIIVVGSGNAALCAGIAALEAGADVLIVEKADTAEAGGNTRYTAGAMRFVYDSGDDLLPLLLNPDDPRIQHTEFGAYPRDRFQQDLLNFNDGQPLSMQQHLLIDGSYDTLRWLATHDVRFEPIYERQSYKKNGKHVFWGGLTLASRGEGDGLFQAELAAFLRLGGCIEYETEATRLLWRDHRVAGVCCRRNGGDDELLADAVILASGGFEANAQLRQKYLGQRWQRAKVRGTRHNMGKGLEMGLSVGGAFEGRADGCHAVPMDLNMPDYGNLDLAFIERKHYRKICYFLGVMLNANGERFVDEGKNFRNYTYAQFGRAVLEQPGAFAWQIFDSKVEHLLYGEYRFWDASFVTASTLPDIVAKLDGVDADCALATLNDFNQSITTDVPFDPTKLDGRGTEGLTISKSNWAYALDTPPYRAYPVTCGITFTYGGLRLNNRGQVLREDNTVVDGLYACGELAGGVFFGGYPGGSGLTSGAVFGRLAGAQAVAQCVGRSS